MQIDYDSGPVLLPGSVRGNLFLPESGMIIILGTTDITHRSMVKKTFTKSYYVVVFGTV